MLYVYILSSLKQPGKIYIGKTKDMQNRLSEHNSGESSYTKKYAPWKMETFVAFTNEALATNFEKYLKHGSGFAFLKRHFIPRLKES